MVTGTACSGYAVASAPSTPGRRLQRVNLAIGTLGLVLLVAFVIERRWLVVLSMALVGLAQAIAFLGERRRFRGQR
jgi:hypothetical protein